jgi:hypothetical protein
MDRYTVEALLIVVSMIVIGAALGIALITWVL